MLTKDDIKKLADNFATKLDLAVVKSDLQFDMKKIREEMATKDNFRKMMTNIDAVYKEVKDRRIEQSMHTGSHQRIDEEVDSLKRKVSKLEKSPITLHSIKR